eukprot:Tamp_41593.p1 GENE.Tamp_41593~~Tamp_41593.p1  ORF type:complete len:134 (-),score=2.30 Tamp_41593:21-422(-)
MCGKRDLHVWQKRPTCVAKETYMCGKRDLKLWQKREAALTTASRYGHRFLTQSLVLTHVRYRSLCLPAGIETTLVSAISLSVFLDLSKKASNLNKETEARPWRPARLRSTLLHVASSSHDDDAVYCSFLEINQ